MKLKFACDWLCVLALLAAMPWFALAAKPEAPKPEAPKPAAVAQLGPMALGVTLADDGRGVRVVNIQPDSPASKARLHPGDRLLSVNGQSVLTAAEVMSIVHKSKPGARFKIEIDREGLKGSLWLLPVATHPGLHDRVVRDGSASSQRRDGPAALGVTLYDGPYTGVRVLTVLPNSPAARAGLRVGDHILSIDGVDVADSGDIIASVANSHPGDAMRLRINREGLEGSITAVLGDRDSVFGRPTAPIRYRGPAEESDRFFQPTTPGEINDQRSYGSG